MDADLRTERVGLGFQATLSKPLTTRTVSALGRILRTQKRTLDTEDFAALACLRDTLAQTLASGKPYEGRLADYE